MGGHSTCCVVNCKNNGKNSACKFYSFPTSKWTLQQRQKWIAAVNRKNADGSPWHPKRHDVICSEHFIGGKKSDAEASPSYIPTIFPPVHRRKKIDHSQVTTRRYPDQQFIVKYEQNQLPIETVTKVNKRELTMMGDKKCQEDIYNQFESKETKFICNRTMIKQEPDENLDIEEGFTRQGERIIKVEEVHPTDVNVGGCVNASVSVPSTSTHVPIEYESLTIKLELDTEGQGPVEAGTHPLREACRYCNVYGCTVNSSMYPDFAFFPIPKDEFRHKEWLQRIGRKDLADSAFKKNILVCELHFNEQDIVLTSNSKTLKRTALPESYKINIPAPKRTEKAVQATPVTTSTHAQTEAELPARTGRDVSVEADFETADDYKKRIKSKLTAAKKYLKQMQNGNNHKTHFRQSCDRFLSPNLADLIKSQVDLKNKPRGNRYSLTHKTFGLNLFFTNSSVHNLLAKDLRLPNYIIYQQQAELGTVFSKDLLAALKLKVQKMTEREKFCSVAVDMIKLKGNLFYNGHRDKIVGLHEIDGSQIVKPARHAVVILVHGIFDKWMQPVGFAFLSDTKTAEEVSIWINNILEKLLETGLKIKTYVPRFQSKLLDEEKIRGISKDQPYFYINSKKIHFIFCVPDLIENLSNSFYRNNFHYQRSDGSTGVAEYAHVKKFYELDVSRNMRLAPELKVQASLGPGRCPGYFGSQIFSRAVAAGLSAHADLGALGAAARDSAHMLLLISDLFDLLNSFSPSTHTFTGNIIQMQLLNRALEFFNSLTLSHAKTGVNTTPSSEFIARFQVTIQAIVNVFQELQSEGFNSLCTNIFNLEIMEQFFSTVRSKGDMTVDPTSRHFTIIFRKLCFLHLLKHPKGGSICSRELTSLAAPTELADDEEETSASKEKDEDLKDRNILSTKFFDKLKLAGQNSLREICSSLLLRCVEVHKNCNLLEAFVSRYESNECNSDPLVGELHCYVLMVEREFQEAFAQRIVGKLGARLYERTRAAEFPAPCECFPKTLFLKMLLRLRIQMVVNYNNMIYRKKKHRHDSVVIPKIIP